MIEYELWGDRGGQCDVRVPTRWQLSLLLPWLLHWRSTPELHGTLRLAPNGVCYVRRMLRRMRVRTRWWPWEKADGLYTWFTPRLRVVCLHLAHICFVKIERLCYPGGMHMWKIMIKRKEQLFCVGYLPKSAHSTYAFTKVWTTSPMLQSKNSYVRIEVWFHRVVMHAG